MTASRYAEALAPTLAWLEIEHRGWGVVVSPPTEQRKIAAELASRRPDRPVVELGRDATPDWFAAATAGTSPGAFVTLAPDLDDPRRAEILAMLNGQRDRTSDHGVWVLIVSPRELEQVRRHASDSASVFRSSQAVTFIPRPLTDDELRAARAELHAYYQYRFGRLDLRGFIRSEHEDVSFAVEDVFQPLLATAPPVGRVTHAEYAVTDASPQPNGSLALELVPSSLVELLAARATSAARSVLLVGAPGSGKSFFLRWCALVESRDDRFLGIDRPIPIYVPLAAMRAASASPDLEHYAVESLLEAGLAIAHAVAREATAGRVLFLLDGLDEVGALRRETVAGVAALAARYPSSRVVVTSRPTGLDGLAFDADRLELAGLDDDAIRALLTRWCELYETQRIGVDGAARGRAEGAQLADQVVASPTLRELARFPLLATIIAIVHRAGVRLPDHRVELYEHVVRILVERWNQVRSHQAEGATPTIRTANAIRLLGPVAYDMVAAGRDGAIDEASLRDLIQRQLARGTVRVVADADEAIAVFRDSLGLLVEQAPGIYGFLHKTLGEFLAAHDVVRTGTLERLLAPDTCFTPRWREVILLALGIIGNVQANDDRLHATVTTIVDRARAMRGVVNDEVPALLKAIVADEPPLTPDLAASLCDELVTGGPVRILFWGGIFFGPWGAILADSLRRRYAGGLGLQAATAMDVHASTVVIEYLALAGIPPGPLECEFWLAYMLRRLPAITRRSAMDFEGPDSDGSLTLRPGAGTSLASLVRHGAAELVAVDILSAGQRVNQQRPELRGDAVIVRSPLPSPSAVMGGLTLPPPERRLALVPAVLAAWRELAAQYPDGPQPPASVEEAIAKVRAAATGRRLGTWAGDHGTHAQTVARTAGCEATVGPRRGATVWS